MEKKDNSVKTLSVADAVAIIVGVVVSVGIFKTPSIVAANSGNENTLLILWLIGGVVSLIGALCYAELSSTYPHAGGDYHYLFRAYGGAAAFLFAWARMTVIQTGTIAVLAFLIGDYASEVLYFGGYSASVYAALTIVILTGINIAGIRQGMRTQKLLIASILFGLLFVAAMGFSVIPPTSRISPESIPTAASLGTAMIFVLFTYGGWNEAAYLSAEVRNPGRNMVRGLLYSIGIITLIYLIVNFVFIKSLGLSAMSESEVVAADLMRKALGDNGAKLISLMIVVAALSTMNGVIITGARTNYALGCDFSLFGFLGNWKEKSGTPVNALIMQGAVALVLVIIGTATKSGFEMMVEYTTPVFWFFFLFAGISLFVLRRTEPDMERPFRVPLYPFTPFLFCVFCVYMLYSSLAYTGKGALLGIGVLLSGIPLLLIQMRKRKAQ
ncbi:APC family permease [Candidatus Latescibacterota bacterium]